MNYYGKAFYEDMQNTALAIKVTNTILAHKEYLPYYNDFLGRMLKKAIAQDSTSFPLRRILGILKYANKEYSESEKILMRLFAETDSFRITLKYMGLVKFQQNNYNKALPF